MGVCIDHAFYVRDFGGSLTEAEFKRVLPDALRHVAWMCEGQAPDRSELRPYKRAVCACCDVFAENGHGPLRDYTLGAFHVGVAGGAGSGSRSGCGLTGDDLATVAVQFELCCTTLLFSGVR